MNISKDAILKLSVLLGSHGSMGSGKRFLSGWPHLINRRSARGITLTWAPNAREMYEGVQRSLHAGSNEQGYLTHLMAHIPLAQ